MSQIHKRACHLCEAICGLVIETDGSEILSIKGDPDDPLSRGHICPKAVALRDIHEDPDRLRQPMKRVSARNEAPRFEPVSWDEALDAVAKAMVDITDRYSKDGLGIYLGNPTVHNYGMMTHQGMLFKHFRTDNRFSATSVDQLPHHLVSLWLFGHKLLFPIPDIDRSDYFLMLGANPLASNGSIWTVPDIKKRIKDLKARGGKLVVIDPRRTETAELADEHHFIRPGTDALLLAAILNTLLADEQTSPDALTDFTDGLDTVASALAGLTPEFAARQCGIEAETIRKLAAEFSAAGAAICYGRMGVSTQAYGTLCQWLIQLINIATGNLDKPGGSLFTLPAIDQVRNVSPGGFGRHRSRVRDLPEFDRELPAACLAEEITTPGEGQIRGLFTGAGNPVLSTPNGAALDEALQELEFMVSLDPYMNETTRHADYILPPSSPLEHDHYDLAFHTNAMRNTARYNPAVFDKPEGVLHDWEIFCELGNRVSQLHGGDAQPLTPPHAIIDMGLQAGPYAQSHAMSLQTLKDSPSGVDLGPLQPQLPARLRTPEQRINCATPEALADLDRLRAEFSSDDANGLLLIGRRHVRDNNSWMHNYHRLTKGAERCTLLMHPEDIANHQLEDGSEVLVRSRVGQVAVVVSSSDSVMPGVVSLPHGYGHGRDGTRLNIAANRAGVSCNDITDAHALDELSGNAAVNGVPVSVQAIA